MSVLSINDFLTPGQKAVFAKLLLLKQIGILAGGTALAFQLRHRRSFDFDIFTPKNIPADFTKEIKKIFGERIEILKESETELTFYTPAKVKITFFHYPFKSLYPIIRTASIPIFDWREIAADKAYTLGRRPIYRDYVDLFFIIKKGYKLLSSEKVFKDGKDLKFACENNHVFCRHNKPFHIHIVVQVTSRHLESCHTNKIHPINF